MFRGNAGADVAELLRFLSVPHPINPMARGHKLASVAKQKRAAIKLRNKKRSKKHGTRNA